MQGTFPESVYSSDIYHAVFSTCVLERPIGYIYSHHIQGALHYWPLVITNAGPS